MTEHSNPPRRDWGLYGLVVGVGGILALLIFAEGRVINAQQKTEVEKLRAELLVTRAEQQAFRKEQNADAEALRAEIQAFRKEQSAEAETLREERKAEAEETRRYVAEAIANANERAAVNSIRIDHLEKSEQLPPDSPPAN